MDVGVDQRRQRGRGLNARRQRDADFAQEAAVGAEARGDDDAIHQHTLAVGGLDADLVAVGATLEIARGASIRTLPAAARLRAAAPRAPRAARPSFVPPPKFTAASGRRSPQSTRVPGVSWASRSSSSTMFIAQCPLPITSVVLPTCASRADPSTSGMPYVMRSASAASPGTGRQCAPRRQRWPRVCHRLRGSAARACGQSVRPRLRGPPGRRRSPRSAGWAQAGIVWHVVLRQCWGQAAWAATRCRPMPASQSPTAMQRWGSSV